MQDVMIYCWCAKVKGCWQLDRMDQQMSPDLALVPSVQSWLNMRWSLFDSGEQAFVRDGNLM